MNSSSSAFCYYPDGEVGPLQSCSPDLTNPLSAVCCLLDRANPPGGDSSKGLTADECLPNGVCQNRMMFKGNMQRKFYRNGCTDKEWTAGTCFDLCTEGESKSTYTEITPCDGSATSSNWCCGSTADCCKQGSTLKKYTIDAVFGRAVTGSTSSLAPTPTPSGAASAFPNPSQTTPSANDHQNQNTPQNTSQSSITVGVGVGAGLGILLAIAVVAFVWWKCFKRPRNDGSQLLDSDKNAIWEAEANTYIAEIADGKIYAELASGKGQADLAGGQRYTELP